MKTNVSDPGVAGARGGGPIGEGDGRRDPLLRRALLQARWELRVAAGTSPFLSSLLIRHSGVRVEPDTDIVIEGFPRTGNTFAVTAFLQSNPGARVAHHVHVPAQLISGIRKGLPCLALTRSPEEAVLSLVVRLPHLSIRRALRAYVRFYEPLLPYRNLLVVADLQDLSGDFGAVVGWVNAAFGTSFAGFDHSPESIERVMAAVDASDRSAFPRAEEFERSRARPTELRERQKERLRRSYRAAALRGLRARAERAHAGIRGLPAPAATG